MRVLGWRGRWGLAVPAVLAAACLALWVSSPPADAPARSAGAPAGAKDLSAAWVGSGSCSGRGCHGAVAPEGTKGSEYNTWRTSDRHARAFDVLLDERSRRIEMNFRMRDDLKAAHAANDALCLKCHSQTAPKTPPVRPELATTGVGCESCHGRAGDWLDEHYSAAWAQAGAQEKQARGMVLMDTADSLVQVCTRCHVGNAEQEVNHDLIAAGHPRLNFEMTAYLADMPKHWDQADVARKPRAISEAEIWLVGQVVTARAALDLLKARASSAKAPWPEFSEYGCFACHHDLRDQGMKFWRPALGLPPGTLPWGTWTFALIQPLTSGPGGAVDDLGRLMGAPSPDRQAVVGQVATLDQALDGWLGRLQAEPFDCKRLQSLLVSLREDRSALERLTAHWDAAAQLYLALVALQECLGGGQEFRDALEKLRALLMFPTCRDSPDFTFDPVEVRDAVVEVFQALPGP